jgi:hypothetical protein
MNVEQIRAENGEHKVLFGQVTFGEALLHFTAIQVEKDEEGYYRATEPEWESELERLHALAEPDGEMMTTPIEGYDGDFIVFLYPFTR